ncbi:polyprenol phosphomannose-dependent alpha 1,6 mannosyltransferase MptB [Saccharopolyspora spinosporotrichia]
MPPSVSTSSAQQRWSGWTELVAADVIDNGGRGLRGPLPLRTIALGAIGSVLLLAGSFGAAGVLVHDPILGSGPLSAMRYGHGKDLATAVVYLGFGLLVWAWVRLGRGVLARLVDSRGVLLATAAWLAPMLAAPPLFTRDVYSYLGQGLLALHGIDPYAVGPSALTGPIPDNVHPTWQTTPAPYGPLFMGVAKGVILVAGDGMISSVIVMRLVLLCGLGMLIFALPGLVRHLGAIAGRAVAGRGQPDDRRSPGRWTAQRHADDRPARGRHAADPRRQARGRAGAGDHGDGDQGDRRARAPVPGVGVGVAPGRPALAALRARGGARAGAVRGGLRRVHGAGEGRFRLAARAVGARDDRELPVDPDRARAGGVRHRFAVLRRRLRRVRLRGPLARFGGARGHPGLAVVAGPRRRH